MVDASSDLLSRPVSLDGLGLLYGGAQKNLGPAGVTVVVVRRDLAERGPDTLPSTLRYAVAARHGSRYNTPPVFAIYLAGLVLRWLRDQGGLDRRRRPQPAQGGSVVRCHRSGAASTAVPPTPRAGRS